MGTQSYSGTIRPENYRLLQQSVYSAVGIVLDEDKHYLLEGRLAPIVKELGLNSINELCGVLQSASSSHIGQMVAEAMTTNETFFFREPVQYDVIRKMLLPKLRAERDDTRKLRFWSAASSTGQEAYSLAMLLAEEQFRDWNIHILGSDFTSKVIERAQQGLYQQLEVNRGLPAQMLIKYFRRAGVDWQIKDELRKMAHFEKRDLRDPMRTLGPFDLVFCRNVMIYFDAPTRKRIMKEIHGTLFRGGWLLLGGAEAALEMDEFFEKRRIGDATVYVAK